MSVYVKWTKLFGISINWWQFARLDKMPTIAWSCMIQTIKQVKGIINNALSLEIMALHAISALDVL